MPPVKLQWRSMQVFGFLLDIPHKFTGESEARYMVRTIFSGDTPLIICALKADKNLQYNVEMTQDTSSVTRGLI